jgi:hypothetical protein
MEKVKQAATQHAGLPIREVSIAELISLAIARRRKLEKEGKTSRRISLLLNPRLIPPADGEYDVAIGKVRIRSVFLVNKGRWAVTVILPPSSGFELKDHLKDHLPSQDK